MVKILDKVKIALLIEVSLHKKTTPVTGRIWIELYCIAVSLYSIAESKFNFSSQKFE